MAVMDAAAFGLAQSRQFGLNLGDQWAAEAAHTASAMFSNQALMPMAALLATADPYALDYLKQCPVLVVAVMKGQKRLDTKKRHYFLTQWKALTVRRPKLRDLMRLWQLPLPMRAIQPRALCPRHWLVLQELAKIAPSTLAQSIPSAGQLTWLRAMDIWMGTMQRRHAGVRVLGRIPFLDWAAQHWQDDPVVRRGNPNAAGDVADFAAACEQFNPRWTWQQAVAAQIRWHHDLALKKYGTATVDTSPFPRELEVSGYSFHALNSPAELAEEGALMHHCVASYEAQLMEGVCRIVSMRKDGKRLATIEFSVESTRYIDHATMLPAQRLSWKMRQFRGPCNQSPAAALQVALTNYRGTVRESSLAAKKMLPVPGL